MRKNKIDVLKDGMAVMNEIKRKITTSDLKTFKLSGYYIRKYFVNLKKFNQKVKEYVDIANADLLEQISTSKK